MSKKSEHERITRKHDVVTMVITRNNLKHLFIKSKNRVIIIKSERIAEIKRLDSTQIVRGSELELAYR
jgi:hypothetical protein